MKLSQMFSGQTQVNEMMRREETHANQQMARNTASVSRQIRSLVPGQTISGEIVGKNGGEVQIKLAEDMVLNARVDRNLNIEIGKNMTFEVKNNGSSLTLSPLFTNVSTDVNVLKALDMAALPVNQASVEMTEKLMGAGLPVNRNTLLQVYREINSFPQASISDVVDLHRLQMPVNEANLNQMASYRNLTHQMLQGLETVADVLPKVFDSLQSAGDAAGAVKLYQELFMLVQEDGQDGQMLTESTDSLLENVAQKEDVMQGDAAQNTAAQGSVTQDGAVQAAAENSVTQGTMAQEGVTQDGAAQAAAENSVTQGTMAQEGVTQDGVTQDGAVQAAVENNAVQGTMAQEGITQDGAAQTAAENNAVQGTAVQEGVTQDGAAQAAAENNAPQRTMAQDGAPRAEAAQGAVTGQENINTADREAQKLNLNVMPKEPGTAGGQQGEAAVQGRPTADGTAPQAAEPSWASEALRSAVSDEVLSVVKDLPLTEQQMTEAVRQANQFAAGEIDVPQFLKAMNQLAGNINSVQYSGNNATALVTDGRDRAVRVLARMFSQPSFKNLLNGQLKKMWTVSPKEVAESGKIEELYRRLDRQLKGLSHALENVGQADSAAYKAVSNMAQNVDFLQQINQMYAYVQLPLRLQQGEAHGELYVYTNKKHMARADGKVSALLHLDMEHLGPVEVYVTLQNSKVNTSFRVRDDEMLEFLSEHMDLLTERLKKRGYDCSYSMTTKDITEEGTAESGIAPILQQEKGIALAQYAFDVRT